jgi:hypothetical protein
MPLPNVCFQPAESEFGQMENTNFRNCSGWQKMDRDTFNALTRTERESGFRFLIVILLATGSTTKYQLSAHLRHSIIPKATTGQML